MSHAVTTYQPAAHVTRQNPVSRTLTVIFRTPALLLGLFVLAAMLPCLLVLVSDRASTAEPATLAAAAAPSDCVMFCDPAYSAPPTSDDTAAHAAAQPISSTTGTSDCWMFCSDPGTARVDLGGGGGWRMDL